MKLIERNFFQKILLKIFPNSNNLFLVDDFKKIDLLFNEKKILAKVIFKNFIKLIHPITYKLIFIKSLFKHYEKIYRFLVNE